MQQYHAIKSRYPHALLLFRLGDFYELFYEDAMLASRELQITLTSRNREKGQPIPMCGVPYHAADGYVAKLIRAGFKIAICDQMEQPGPNFPARAPTKTFATSYSSFIRAKLSSRDRSSFSKPRKLPCSMALAASNRVSKIGSFNSITPSASCASNSAWPN